MLSAAAEKAVATLGRDAMRTAARHVLWRRGDLSFLLHPLQRAAIDAFKASPHWFALWNWARRLGKSWGFMATAYEVALSKPRARIPYAASTAVSLKEFIVPIAIEFAETAPRELRPEIVDHEVRFKNGSRIVMQGCEDRAKANRLRGPSADLVIVDEAAFIPDLDYVVRSIMLPQLLTTSGKMLIGSTPPETPAHSFRSLAKQAEESGVYSHHTIHDAPHIKPEQIAKYCEAAGGETSTTWKREGLAQFVTDPAKAIVPEFEAAEKEIVIEIPRPKHFDAYVVGDAGWTDLTVALFGYYHFAAAVIVIEDELPLERATTDVVQQGTARKEAMLWGDPCPGHVPGCARCVGGAGWVASKKPLRRVMDTSARTAADMTRLQDDADPTSEARWRVAENQDREAAVNALRIEIQKRRVLISPKCKTLISHLRHGVWNDKRTDFARPKQHDTSASDGVVFGHFDGVAALMYFVRHVDRNRNPNPDPPVNPATQRVPTKRDQSGWSGIVRRKERR